jgi:hypothetical protein
MTDTPILTAGPSERRLNAREERQFRRLVRDDIRDYRAENPGANADEIKAVLLARYQADWSSILEQLLKILLTLLPLFMEHGSVD